MIENENRLLEQRNSLCEVLDRVLNKGAVITGELVISVADIDLLYVGIGLVISSVETLLNSMDPKTRKKEIDHETL